MTAFELSWELRRLAFNEYEFKSEYLVRIYFNFCVYQTAVIPVFNYEIDLLNNNTHTQSKKVYFITKNSFECFKTVLEISNTQNHKSDSDLVV